MIADPTCQQFELVAIRITTLSLASSTDLQAIWLQFHCCSEISNPAILLQFQIIGVFVAILGI